jgi:hypothetical protein
MLPTIAVMIPINELHRWSCESPSSSPYTGPPELGDGVADATLGVLKTVVVATSSIEVERNMSGNLSVVAILIYHPTCTAPRALQSRE